MQNPLHVQLRQSCKNDFDFVSGISSLSVQGSQERKNSAGEVAFAMQQQPLFTTLDEKRRSAGHEGQKGYKPSFGTSTFEEKRTRPMSAEVLLN